MTAEKPLVLHLSSLGAGGAETTLFRLVTNDSRFRHHVVSLTDLDHFGERLRAAGITVTALNLPRGKLRLGPLLKLWRLVRAERPHAVQTWMYHSDLIGGLVARLAGHRGVFWNIRHSSLDAGHNSRKTIASAKLGARLSYVLPQRIVCCGKTALMVHSDLGYDTRRMVVIPNGYDLAQLYPDAQAGRALRQEIGVPENGILLGMVGRFAPEKDHGNLLAALAQVAGKGVDFNLLLAGSGLDSGNARLAALIARHGLGPRTRLLGPRNDIRAVMSALDLHILSSRSEGFPNVVAEAMACGTVPISTRAGDATEIVGDVGWLVPTGSPADLTYAVLEAIHAMSDQQAWQKRRVAARAYVAENFELTRMVQRYNDLWLNDVHR